MRIQGSFVLHNVKRPPAVEGSPSRRGEAIGASSPGRVFIQRTAPGLRCTGPTEAFLRHYFRDEKWKVS